MVYTHSARTVLRYLRTPVVHFSFSKNICSFSRLEEDELVTPGDIHFRRLFAKCASRVRVCGQNKRNVGTSSTIRFETRVGNNLVSRHELNGVMSYVLCVQTSADICCF